VPLEATFHDLSRQLARLLEAFRDARLTVVEDAPLRDTVALVDRLGDAIEDVVGWAQEAFAASNEAEHAVAQPLDSHRARQALTTCQERFNRLTSVFSSDLVSYERIVDLQRLAQRPGGEWRLWVSAVRQVLERVRPPIQDVSQALFLCWQALAERLGTASVSIQNTTIGQQISTTEATTGEMTAGGAT